MAFLEQQSRQKVLLLLFLVAIASIAALLWGRSRKSAALAYAYYYDLEAGRLFVAKESTPSSVTAVVMSCGQCDNSDSHEIAWLEDLTTEAKRALAEIRRPGSENRDADTMLLREVGAGELIASVPPPGGDADWAKANSDAGSDIRKQALAKCGGSLTSFSICSPRADELP